MTPQREARLARTVVFLVIVMVIFGFGVAAWTAPDARPPSYRWGPPPALCGDCRAGGG